MRRCSFTLALLAATQLAWPAGADPVARAGWRAVGQAARYDRATVWQAINGAAELYLAYDMRSLLVQSYRSAAVTAQVQRYDLGRAINAFGVFRRECPPTARPVKVATEGAVVAPHQCLGYRGRHYLRASVVKGKLTAAACASLLTVVAAALPAGAGPPPQLALLPTRGRVAGSERYTRRACLGLRGLRRCLQADYRGAGKQTYRLLVVLPGQGAASLGKVFKGLAGRWKPAGSGILTRKVPYRGLAVLLKTRRGIFGVVGAGDLAASLALVRKVAASGKK